MLLYAEILAYRTDAFPEAPEGWDDFWDIDAIPGQPNDARHAARLPFLEAAVIADGVPVDEVYPVDLDRAFASLRPHPAARRQVVGQRARNRRRC